MWGANKKQTRMFCKGLSIIKLVASKLGCTGQTSFLPFYLRAVGGGIARYIYHSVFGRFFSKMLFNLLVLIFLDYFLVVYDRKIHFQA